MKLVYIFFIFIVAAIAHPNKRDIDEEIRKMKESLPFMAIIYVTDGYMESYKWAIILTEKWLLSPCNFSLLKKIDISVQIYTDFFTSTRFEYGIESIRELKLKQFKNGLHPLFNLIELQSSITFGDSRKPIPLAGPNFEWNENKEATAYHLNSESFESPELHEYFQSMTIKVDNENESELLSCLSQKLEILDELNCDPVIHNGSLIGFHINDICENHSFLKISSIYELILNNVPEIYGVKYKYSFREQEKLHSKLSLFQRLFGFQDLWKSNINVNNININITIS